MADWLLERNYSDLQVGKRQRCRARTITDGHRDVVHPAVP